MYDNEQQQKFLEIEFQELFVTFRHYIQIVTNLIAAFVAAYVAVIGVAINTQSAGLVLVSIGEQGMGILEIN